MSIIEKAMEKATQNRTDVFSKEENKALSEDKNLDSATALANSSVENKKAVGILNSISKLEVKAQAKQPALSEPFKEIEENNKPEDIKEHEELVLAQSNVQVKPEVKINPTPELIMATEKALIEGGSYRILKEYIIALRKNSPDKSIFMITSPMKGEGKTLVSCNLACTLASEFDTTVLLIDVDLRAPSCHRVFGIENPPMGLSDCLLGKAAITDCIINTGVGKLSLLCAGSIIPNPTELITSKLMQEFLQEVKHRYPDRIIILDSLPLLPFAESRALSRMTDGVMLVVRENTTDKRHLESALQQLYDVPFLGMIYNSATTLGKDKDIYNLSRYAY